MAKEQKHTINEISINAKKRNEKNVEDAYREKKAGYNGIHYIAVFSAENPDSVQATNSVNKKATHSLSKDLKAARYPIIPATGKFGGNVEHSYAIINIGLDACKYFCGKYQQTSFVYTTIIDGEKVHSEYYEKLDATKPYNKTTNPYVVKDFADGFTDMSDADDFFTVIGKGFKYQIPFPTMTEASATIIGNFLCEENSKFMNGTLNEVVEFSTNGVGLPPVFRRNLLYKGLL